MLSPMAARASIPSASFPLAPGSTPKPFAMRSCEKRACKSSGMCSCKIKGLKLPWNQHLQKMPGGPPSLIPTRMIDDLRPGLRSKHATRASRTISSARSRHDFTAVLVDPKAFLFISATSRSTETIPYAGGSAAIAPVTIFSKNLSERSVAPLGMITALCSGAESKLRDAQNEFEHHTLKAICRTARARLESILRPGPHAMNLLDDLNPRQREAVLATEGPVLVLAGAGTGKTRVVTYRIAYLVEQGVAPESLLAVTFTNKAADQMKERVAAVLARSGGHAGDLWISTFHSFCARLLRREAPRLDLPHDFAIYDEEDQIAAVKLALAQLGSAEPGVTARALLERISLAKNHGHSADLLAAEATDERDRLAAKVFEPYQRILHKAGALDFDDLLLRALDVLDKFDDARAKWADRFRYILVDEYQDTNRIQYELLYQLAGERRNLCVVGDEDQSIYSWRGADVGNILRFEEDFPGARVIRLEQNYRSTQKILDAAGRVVARNVRRLGKSLAATRGEGSNLKFYEARDAAAEAEYVAGQLLVLQRRDSGARLAVLYRTNFQSRALEEALRRLSLRYLVLGGFSFYQRAEIKDALAYVRLAINPDDDVSLLRVLNTPPRGIGPKAVESLRAMARERGTSLWAAIVGTTDSTATGSAPLRDFRALIEGLRADFGTLPTAGFLRLVLDRSGYLEMLKHRNNAEDAGRVENLQELVNALAEGTERGEVLSDFLDRAALVSDADDYDERAPISLMTLHSAKGLEFDHVFLAGLEEGVFPHSRAREREEDIEEERRLCYVGMTRAKETLTLTRAVYRRTYGNERVTASLPSRFLSEIPGELVDTAAGSLAEAGATRRYEPDPEYSYSSTEFAQRVRHPPRGEQARRAREAPSPPRATRARSGNTNPLLGVRVRHATYGEGTIIAVEGEGDDRKLTVSFIDHGTKKFLERYAQLEFA